MNAENPKSIRPNKDQSQEVEKARQSDDPELDIPPDGGYGWLCVACIFLVNAHTWGLNSVSGIKPYHNFHCIWQRDKLGEGGRILLLSDHCHTALYD